MQRRLTLTVALDWPSNAGQVKLFTQALEAEFAATKEKRFTGQYMGVGITVNSARLAGNRTVPRIWRQVVRYLQWGHVISTASDPWCYHAEVVEIDRDEPPSVVITITET